jgi:hypothetical protein
VIDDVRIVHTIHVDVVNAEMSVGRRNPDKQAPVNWHFPDSPMRTAEIASFHDPVAFRYDVNGLELHIRD